MGQWGPLTQRVSAGIRQLSQQAPPGFRGPSGGSNSVNPKSNDVNSCPGSGATRRCSPIGRRPTCCRFGFAATSIPASKTAGGTEPLSKRPRPARACLKKPVGWCPRGWRNRRGRRVSAGAKGSLGRYQRVPAVRSGDGSGRSGVSWPRSHRSAAIILAGGISLAGVSC